MSSGTLGEARYLEHLCGITLDTRLTTR